MNTSQMASPGGKRNKRIKPKDDTDSDDLSDESKMRAEEEAKVIAETQVRQQVEFARRMKVRMLTNLQAIASQSFAMDPQ